MARVEIASLTLGLLTDTAGNSLTGQGVTITNSAGQSVTPYAAATGSSTVSPTSGAQGYVPGFLEEGTYTFTIGATVHTVEVVSGRPLGLVNAKSYGAVGDGTTDDTTAIQAAINAIIGVSGSARGGTVYFPPGTYKCVSSLSLAQSSGITFLGPASPVPGYSPQKPSATLMFSGTGSGRFIDARSSWGFGIRNLGVRYSSGSFTGSLIDYGHDASAQDAAYGLVENCLLSGDGVYSCAALIRLESAIIIHVVGCHLQNAVVGVRCRDDNAAGYSNAHVIRDCTFDNLTGAGIKNAGQQLLVEGNTFEGTNGGSGGMPRAYYDNLLAGSICEGVSFIGNWFGDDVAASTAWIEDNVGQFNGLFIAGNDFRTDNGAITSSVKINNGGTGFSITGNSMGGTAGGLKFGASSVSGMAITGNDFSRAGGAVVNPIAGITSSYTGANVFIAGNRENVSSVRPPTLWSSQTDMFIQPDGTGLIQVGRPGSGGTVTLDISALTMKNTTLGFFNAAPAAKPTGVAVTAAGIHAALVSLGLISA